MRIFLYEYLRALPPGSLSASLQAEGRAMFRAVAEDLTAIPGIEVTVLAQGEDSEHTFRAAATQADWSLVIAPEFDGILATRCRWVEQAGGRLLGPSAEAVTATADKLRLAQAWQHRGVPTPRTFTWSRRHQTTFPAVVKPQDGAGSQATFLVRTEHELTTAAEQARAEGCHSELIVQPLVRGLAASVSVLVGPTCSRSLVPATQDISEEGRFRYRGGRMPLPAPLARRAEGLAMRALAAVPGLGGFVGVDLVLGEAAGGDDDAVIEINPRLTTSYVGLRALCGENLAGLMLRVATGAPVAEPSWHAGPIQFRSNGDLV